jgi:hypothetical protein
MAMPWPLGEPNHYLKEQGWSFEAAHRALLEAAGRR